MFRVRLNAKLIIDKCSDNHQISSLKASRHDASFVALQMKTAIGSVPGDILMRHVGLAATICGATNFAASYNPHKLYFSINWR